MYLTITNVQFRIKALVDARFGGKWADARCAHCDKTEAVLMEEWKAGRLGSPGYTNALLELDHIVELADGGCWWSTWNLQLLCVECHKRKSAKSRSDRAAKKRLDKIHHGA